MRNMAIASILATVTLVQAASAQGQIMVVGGSVQEREAAPGERYVEEIRLRNQTSEPQAVRVYQTDYLFQADGSNVYPPAGSDARSNASWITANPTDLIVPGGADVDVTYQVVVPDEPTLEGTYWSMVMVEPVPDAQGAGSGETGVGLSTTVRFGIQIATHIGGGGSHELRLNEPRLTDERGLRRLQFELVNDGIAGFRPRVSVEVYDDSGTLATSLDVQRGLLYPGTSAIQQVVLDGLAAGTYQAVVVVDTGAPEVFGGQFELTLADAG